MAVTSSSAVTTSLCRRIQPYGRHRADPSFSPNVLYSLGLLSTANYCYLEAGGVGTLLLPPTVAEVGSRCFPARWNFPSGGLTLPIGQTSSIQHSAFSIQHQTRRTTMAAAGPPDNTYAQLELAVEVPGTRPAAMPHARRPSPSPASPRAAVGTSSVCTPLAS
jgi:hypothetical protein